MRVKKASLFLASLVFLLSCRFFQGPAPDSAPVPPAENSPSTISTELDIEYEIFDESPAPDHFTVVRVGESDENLLNILRIEAQKASDIGRQPYVEFYADWCPPCNAIQRNLGEEQMIDAFTGTYIIKLDLDYWKSNLSGTGFYVPGIPAFYEIDTKGNPTGRMITGAAWGEDIPANIAPPMKEFFNGGNSE